MSPEVAVHVIVATGCFGLAAILTYWLSRTRGWISALDVPNERSLHDEPVPRSGGLAIITAAGLASLWATPQLEFPALLPWIAGATFLVLSVSFVDDHRPLPVGLRLLAHFLAAVLLVIAGLVPQVFVLPGLAWAWPVELATVCTILYVVWMVNLFNFMDGMDGFAGGMAAIGFACMAWLGWVDQKPLFALLNAYVALASSGFLLFNFPPARIFLGDVGSSTLGLLAAAFSLWADREGIFPLWVALVVFSPFVVDATLTLVQRLLKGQNVFSAHRNHYYQRTVRLGWGHRRTVLHEYGLMLACAALGIMAPFLPVMMQWVVILSLLMLYLGLVSLVRRLEARHGVGRRPEPGV